MKWFYLEIKVVCGGSPAREVGEVPLSCSPPLSFLPCPSQRPGLRPSFALLSQPCTSHSSCRLGTTALELLSGLGYGRDKVLGAGC